MWRWVLMGICGAALACQAETGRLSEPPVAGGDVDSGYPAELLLPELTNPPSPEVYRIRFETTKGPFLVEVRRDWAPRGSDRLHHLVHLGFYTDCAFFRGIRDFIIQFGVHGDPAISALWAEAAVPDDPRVLSNLRGTISFAQEGPRTRTTQLFINLKDNPELDANFVPVGRVITGMEAVDSLFTGYGELHPKGDGPRPALLNRVGNRYLQQQFPELDYIRQAAIVIE